MAAPGTIAQYSKLIDPAVRKFFIDEYKQLDPKLEYIFKVETARDQTEQEAMYSGLGGLSLIAEGETYGTDAPIQTYSTSYTQAKYGKSASIAYEVKLFEKDSLVAKMPKMEAAAAARKVETLAASVLNNSTNTAYTSYGDGKPLGSTSHTRADGGTAQSNASSTGITLTEANLETAQIAMEELLDDRGQAIDIYANCLVVPTALRKEALVITKSEGKSGVADNDINVYNSGMVKYAGANLDEVVVWKYLAAYLGGSDTRWFLMDKNNHKLTWKWGERPVIEKDDSVGFLNDLMYWKVRFFAAYGWSDFRGIWVSNGDSQAYAS